MMFLRAVLQIYFLIVCFKVHQLEETPRNNKLNDAESSNSRPDLKLSEGVARNEERDHRHHHYAIDHLTSMIEERPNEAHYYKLRGNYHFNKGNYTMAVRDIQKAAKLQPSNQDHGYFLNHIILMYLGTNHEEIEGIFANMSGTELATLGNEFFRMERYNDAARCYTEALNRKSCTMWHRKRGQCFMQLRNFKMAIVDFQKVLEGDPEDVEDGDMARLGEALSYYSEFLESPERTLKLLPVEELFALANDFQSKRYHEEAFRCYHEAIRRSPHHLECRKERGRLYLKQNKMENAIDDFLELAKIDPGDEENWITLGHLLYESEKFSQLIECTRDLRNTTELLELGDIFCDEGKRNEAIRCYTEAVKKAPDDPRPYKRRGHFYLTLDIPNMAILDFLEVAKLQPGDEGNWNSLSRVLIENERINELVEYVFQLADINQLPRTGDTLCDMGKFEEALRCYTEAIRRKPGNAEFIGRRASCYFKMNNLNEAILGSIQAMEFDRKQRQYWDMFTRLLFHEGKIKELIHYSLLHSSSDEIIGLCEKLHTLRKFDDALHCYSQALERRPFDSKIYKSRGCCHLKMKNKNLAKADFLAALDLDPRNTENLAFLNQLLFHSGEGFEDLLKCTLKVEDETELVKLGDQLRSFGRIEEALRCYEAGISRYPYLAVYHWKLGMHHWQRKNIKAAISYMKDAVRIEPKNWGYRLDLIKVFAEAGEWGSDTRRTIGVCASIENIPREHKLWLEKMNRRVATMRTKELVKYLSELIIKDTTRKIDAVRQRSSSMSGTDDQIDNKITELELDRERYLEKLNLASSKYTPDEVFPDVSQIIEAPSEVPDYLTDKMTYELMKDPVITPSGVTYDRTEIMRHLQTYFNDPVGRVPLEAKQLIPNKALKMIIEAWKARHRQPEQNPLMTDE